MKLLKMLTSRLFVVFTLILVQFVWLIALIVKLSEVGDIINICFRVLSLFILLYLIINQDNATYKLAWAVMILVVPLFGGALYLILGDKRLSRRLRRSMDEAFGKMQEYNRQDEETLLEVKEKSKMAYGQALYINRYSGSPIFKGTCAKYFSSGEEAFPYLKEELKKAKHYIFMEYFIIENGRMWSEILEILQQKVKEGVEVRFIYDDIGCVRYIPAGYEIKLRKMGIKCEAFNHFVPFISSVMNHRDHRKITVIDGNVGFTGGYNLADEYINENSRYGYWKDTGVMLKGKAVWNLTVMFLTVWNGIHKEDTDFEKFKSDFYSTEEFADDGYIQPYGDSPLDTETVGEYVYLNMINSSRDYVYITTPYLIIDNEMMTALSLAAKRGVDVRIITPGIPDKKIVFELTKSYYEQLIKAGVKIFQFDEGFVHAKTVICDDRFATVGTINMDYRSLYLHFECGVFFYNTSIISDIKKDFVALFEKCTQITEEMATARFGKRVVQSILRLLAPLF